jgi:hypothetical protein
LGEAQAAHAPFRQVCEEAHFTPQAPQLLRSVSRLMQTLLQTMLLLPVGQPVVTHWPAEQIWLELHVMPHPPQLLGSVCKVTHWPLQNDWPVAHACGQVPFTQGCPLSHTQPQAPQLLVSVCRLVQV